MTARENEYCILDYKKKCDNCGECDRCDINPDKKCNNCGKCMEEEGYDMRAIKIDKVICNNDKVENINKLHNLEVALAENENNEENNKSRLNSEDSEGNKGDSQDDSDPVDAWGPNIEYIDDIEGLNDLLNDIKKLDGNANKNVYEEFPGLVRLKNKKFRN